MYKAIGLIIAMLFTISKANACASCGCSINSDWGTQGLSTDAGWSLDIRYDYLNQNQLRSGTQASTQQVAANTYNPFTNSNAELEGYTKNQYLTASLDYNNGDTWGVSLVVPYIQRDHMTYGVSPSTPAVIDSANGYQSSSSGVGDIRVIGRYYGFSKQRNWGIQYGIKFPTGSINQRSIDGVVAVDPGLQLGTGTTDLILGAFYFDSLTESMSYFAQINYQRALNYSQIMTGSSGSFVSQSYRPGDGYNLTLGFRYSGYETVVPTMQINARRVNPDSGDAADLFATGGTLVYLTPGVIVPIDDNLSLYTTLQIPVYQNVNGVQLTPSYIASMGVRMKF